MRQALLAVSFGTSYHDTLQKNIVPFEQDLASAFPQHTLVRAFTSGLILKKLKQRDNLDIDTVSQGLESLLAQGYTHVLIQPSHVMNGDEYDKLCTQAAPFVSKFKSLVIGAPLLTSAEDYQVVAQAISNDIPARQGQAVVLMGHGSTHHANAVYPMLEYVLHHMGRKDILIGTVEGYPALPQVEQGIASLDHITHIHLRPLMIVAGDHAQNDLAGDDEDSWKSILQSKGFQVSCTLKGLGEYPPIRQHFVSHAQVALQGETR